MTLIIALSTKLTQIMRNDPIFFKLTQTMALFLHGLRQKTIFLNKRLINVHHVHHIHLVHLVHHVHHFLQCYFLFLNFILYSVSRKKWAAGFAKFVQLQICYKVATYFIWKVGSIALYGVQKHFYTISGSRDISKIKWDIR